MFGKLVIYDMFPNIIKLPSDDMEHALDSKKNAYCWFGPDVRNNNSWWVHNNYIYANEVNS